MSQLTPKSLARYIDHTLLKPEATAKEIEKLCLEARQHGFHAVCVPGSRVELACHLLEETDIKVACVVGFPLGSCDSDVKRYETETAADKGAHEIDVVINIGHLKDGNDGYVLRELRDIIEAADDRIVKVILETCLLTEKEKIRACQIASDAGAHFVKTSTGFSTAGASVKDVRMLAEIVGPKVAVKASGGIRDFKTALAMVQAGATRLGTSASVAIVQGAVEKTSEGY